MTREAARMVVAQERRAHVGHDSRRGRVVGELDACEDRDTIESALLDAPALVENGKVQLLVHADAKGNGSAGDETRRRQQESKLEALRSGRAKRYVFALDTAAGRRVVKICEPVGVGNTLAGLCGTSVARREHHLQRLAEARAVAATRTHGFLEWRQGPRLLRACQVQSVLPQSAVALSDFLSIELATHGDAALDPLAEELARMHALPFFHADLKAFHAFVTDISRHRAGEPARYRLQWIDLARVAFRMTRRKRIINLYQALRFVVPRRSEAEERFVSSYCRAASWYGNDPSRGLGVVRRFLDHKLRTHPNP